MNPSFPVCSQCVSVFTALFLFSSVCLFGQVPFSHIAGACRYAQPDYGYSDLKEGKLAIVLYPDTGLIEGTATLWARLSGRPQKIPLLIHSRANLQSITSAKHERLPWCRDGNLVVISLPEHVQGNSHVVLNIQWLVKVGIPSSSGPVTPYLTDEGTYLPSSLLWHPRGLDSDGARWQMTVKTPLKWKLEGTGILRDTYFKERGLFHRFRLDEDVVSVSIAGGHIKSVGRKFFSGAAIHCLAPWKNGGKSNLASIDDDLLSVARFLKRSFGEPCFNGFSIIEMAGNPVQDGFRIAAEHSFVVVSSPPPLLKGRFLEFTATELARNWIGATGAIHDSLSETLSIYLGLLAVRKFDGKETYLSQMRDKALDFEDAATYCGDDRLSGIKGFGSNVSRQTYDILVRKKGPLLLACLEEASGGVKPFVKIINSFMRYHRRNGTGGWREFMGMYERLSGIDLSNFALLYIDGPGLPPGVARRVGYHILPQKGQPEE